MSNLMDEFLAQDLYDEIPEGIPPLDPEDDDEDENQPDPDDHDDGDNGMEPEVYNADLLKTKLGYLLNTETVTYAPKGFDTDTSVGFFLLPENDQDLPGAEDPKHCTLVYLGHIGDDGAPTLGDQKQFLATIAGTVAHQFPRFTAEVTGVEPLGDEGALVWMLDSPTLQEIHDAVLETDSEVASLYGDGTFTKYDPYKPHVTIEYVEPDQEVPEILEPAQAITEIVFDRLALWFGEEHMEFPLGGEA